jgi:hypothetical protein
MYTQGEFQPGTTVPVTGRYELCNVFGCWTGVSETFLMGETLPAGPRGWFWSLMPDRDGPKNRP